jgi:hemerythrin-like metal-binding protein
MTFHLTLTPKQLCHNEVMDTQHEHLAGIINRFFRCWSRQCSCDIAKVVCGALLEELVEETEEHFTAEDCAMIRTVYPRTDEHRRAHTDLLQEAIALFLDLREDRRAVDIGFFEHLQRWFFDHISDEDVALGVHLAAWSAAHPGEPIPYSVVELGEKPPPIPPDHPAALEPA